MREIQFTEITTCQNQSQSLLRSFDPSFLCSFTPSLLRSFAPLTACSIELLLCYLPRNTDCHPTALQLLPTFTIQLNIRFSNSLFTSHLDRSYNPPEYVSLIQNSRKDCFIYLTLETTPHVTNRPPMQSIHSDATYPFTLWGPLHNHSTCSRMTNVSTNLEDPYLQIIHVL